MVTYYEQEKALQALQAASANQVHLTYLPDGSLLIHLSPQRDVSPESAASMHSADEQKALLDLLPEDETEDSEEWIETIHTSRINKGHIPFA